MSLNSNEKSTAFGLGIASLFLFVIAGYLFFLKYPPGKVIYAPGYIARPSSAGRASSVYVSTWTDILQSTLLPLVPAIILLICLIIYLLRRTNRVDD